MITITKKKNRFKFHYLTKSAALFSVLGGIFSLLLKSNSSSFLGGFQFPMLLPLPSILFILSGFSLFVLCYNSFPGRQILLGIVRTFALILILTGILFFATSLNELFTADLYTPVAAANFAFAGACLLFLTFGQVNKTFVQSLILVPVTLNAIAIAAYLAGRDNGTDSEGTAVVTTALLSLMLFIGIALMLTESSLAKIILSNKASGYISRNLLPLVLTIPFTALLLKQNFINSYSPETETWMTALILFNICLAVAMIVFNAYSLDAFTNMQQILTDNQARQTRELQKGYELYKGIICGSHDFIAAIDTDYKIIAFNDAYNDAFAKVTGKKICEGLTMQELLKDTQNTILQDWQKTLAGEQFCITKEVKTTDGSVRYYEFSFSPLKDSNNQIIGALHIVRDTTEKNVALQRIESNSLLLQSIVSNMPVIIFKMDRKGTILELLDKNTSSDFRKNQSLQELFPGCFPDGLSGNKSQEVMIVEEGKEKFYELYTFAENSCEPLITGFALDITSKKITERELKQAKEKAELASRSKTRFVSMMSHDIRTPLNSIIGFAEQLGKENLKEKSKVYLNHIANSGHTLLKLAGDILDIGKIEEGKFELEEDSIDLKQLLHSTLSPLQETASVKGLYFNLLIDQRIPDLLTADELKLRQLFINLAGNALKFTGTGGITIHAECMHISPEICTVSFGIQDTGTGIPPEKQNKIFDRYNQADFSIHRKYGGSGLGLTIVREILTLMNSEVTVKSPVNDSTQGGPGTLFSFTLNFKSATAIKAYDKPIQDEVAPPGNLQFSSPIKILVVEDNELNRSLAGVIINNMGGIVEFASNGKEAIRRVAANDYDIVLMDIQLPLINGIQATTIIRNFFNDAVPVIAITANVNKDDLEKARQAGINDFIRKPYTEKEVYTTVSKWVRTLPIVEKPQPHRFTNLKILKQICRNDRSIIRQMILQFFKQKKECLEKIDQAIANEDWDKILVCTHRLKPFIQLIGATALVETIHMLEVFCKNKVDADSIRELVATLRQVADFSAEELKQELESLQHG